MIAKRLSPSGGQHGEGITTSQHGLHNRPLTGSEAIPSEMRLQRLLEQGQNAPDLVAPDYPPQHLVSGHRRRLELIGGFLHQLKTDALASR